MNLRTLSIRGATEHNLQGVDLDLPHGRLIAFCGVSGSGKTSLVFDTVYAEARRRYLAALEPGEGGLWRALRAPRARRIDGLAPAVALSQAGGRQHPRSTVATLAGIHDFLRLLFARVGEARCLSCGAGVQAQRFEEVYERAAGLAEGTRLQVLAPRRLQEDEDEAAFLEWVDRSGYRRIRAGGEELLVEEASPGQLGGRRLEVVVDRLVVKPDTLRRLRGSLQAALEVGEGQVVLAPAEGGEMRFAVRPACLECGRPFRAITPSLFSFNSALGACPECRGLGLRSGLSFQQVFSGGRATLEEALGRLWEEFGQGALREQLQRFCARQRVDEEAPVGEWDPEAAARLWGGEGRRGGFAGLERALERLRARAQGGEQEWLEERLGDEPCPACGGARLNPEALAVEVGGASIAALSALSIEAAARFFAEVKFSGARAPVGRAIASQIGQSLETLSDLGLDYLALERRADSLSSGEFQRLRLGAALGSGLSQVLYILDEPSIGLHARDAERLGRALEALCAGGNTALVVEHDPALIALADLVVELGPGAGERGGTLVALASAADLALGDTLTGRYLAGRLRLGAGRGRRPGGSGWLRLGGASGHNLKDIDVDFPLGCLVCVTGVSGSGKSSLVHETLYRLLAARLQGAEVRPLPFARCDGVEQVERVVAVDQKPIGRTPRSNAATYTGLLGPVRRLFAELPEARVRAYRPAHFSFNAEEGACPSCRGSGLAEVRQGLFEDLHIPCRSCGGRRYRPEVLDVHFRGRHIAEVLDMSAEQALNFFAAVPEVARRLRLLADVGLGYLRLGQSASSFSGGEAQRVKLAAELGRPQRAHTLYILDEPTTGLHLEDVRFLLELLQRLVDEGNTVIVVEHHIELIACADYAIDLGPEGGQGGGRVVATGPPGAIAGEAHSHTGRFLKTALAED